MSTASAVEELLSTLPTDQPEASKIASQVAALSRLDRDRATNLAKIKTQIKQLDTLLGHSALPQAAGLREWLSSYRDQITDLERDLKRRFGKELADGLKPLGLSLGGQYPLLQAAIFTFNMLEEKSTVEIWYGPKQELLGTAPLVAADVCKRVEQLYKQLGSDLPTAEWLDKLEIVYRQLRQHEQDSVKVTDLLPAMAYQLQSAKWRQNPVRENYRSYSRADFSYDLARCGRDPALRGRIQLEVASRALTHNRNDFLWIPDETSAGGMTYAYLKIINKE